MSLDAMKQALTALERGETKLRYEAITALRAAIEKAERPWQGLMDEELWELWNSHTEQQPFPEWFVDFKRAYKVIAEKLKEKNV